ncbi:MAG: hypothetical protein B7X10_02815, partial [Burkholderiales bacterium 21-58-4]
MNTLVSRLNPTAPSLPARVNYVPLVVSLALLAVGANYLNHEVGWRQSSLWLVGSLLGVTLYQLLTGQLPFQAESMATLMFKIANEAHAPATSLRPDLPNCVNTLMDRALQKNPDMRYQRGADFAHDVR